VTFLIGSYDFGNPYAKARVYDAAKLRVIRIIGITVGIIAAIALVSFAVWSIVSSRLASAKPGSGFPAPPREMVVVTKDADAKSSKKSLEFTDTNVSGEWTTDGISITATATVHNVGTDNVMFSVMPTITYGSDERPFKLRADTEKAALGPDESVSCSFTAVVPADCEVFGILHSLNVEDEGLWRIRNGAKESVGAAVAKHQREEEAAKAAAKEEERKAAEAKKAEEEAKRKAAEEAIARRAATPETSSSSSKVFDKAPDKSVYNETEWVTAWGNAIDAYLDSRGDVPLRGYGQKFAQAAWDYDCDPRISVCISETESGNGAVCFMPYNAWGWLGHSFESFDDGIRQHAKYLTGFYGMPFTKERYATYCGGVNTDYLWDWIWRAADTIVPSGI
jgi:hypothetical protein